MEGRLFQSQAQLRGSGGACRIIQSRDLRPEDTSGQIKDGDVRWDTELQGEEPARCVLAQLEVHRRPPSTGGQRKARAAEEHARLAGYVDHLGARTAVDVVRHESLMAEPGDAFGARIVDYQ
jgi:hypothetical protein